MFHGTWLFHEWRSQSLGADKTPGTTTRPETEGSIECGGPTMRKKSNDERMRGWRVPGDYLGKRITEGGPRITDTALFTFYRD